MDTKIIAIEVYISGKRVLHEVYDDHYPLEKCERKIDAAENGMLFVTLVEPE